ncbi:unnamed protein product [Camellia sinensis]
MFHSYAISLPAIGVASLGHPPTDVASLRCRHLPTDDHSRRKCSKSQSKLFEILFVEALGQRICSESSFFKLFSIDSRRRNTSSVSSVSHWDGEWHSDLLGCSSEPLLCIKTFFCPCGTFSKIATVVTNSFGRSVQ